MRFLFCLLATAAIAVAAAVERHGGKVDGRLPCYDSIFVRNGLDTDDGFPIAHAWPKLEQSALHRRSDGESPRTCSSDTENRCDRILNNLSRLILAGALIHQVHGSTATYNTTLEPATVPNSGQVTTSRDVASYSSHRLVSSPRSTSPRALQLTSHRLRCTLRKTTKEIQLLGLHKKMLNESTVYRSNFRKKESFGQSGRRGICQQMCGSFAGTMPTAYAIDWPTPIRPFGTSVSSEMKFAQMFICLSRVYGATTPTQARQPNIALSGARARFLELHGS